MAEEALDRLSLVPGQPVQPRLLLSSSRVCPSHTPRALLTSGNSPHICSPCCLLPRSTRSSFPFFHPPSLGRTAIFFQTSLRLLVSDRYILHTISLSPSLVGVYVAISLSNFFTLLLLPQQASIQSEACQIATGRYIFLEASSFLFPLLFMLTSPYLHLQEVSTALDNVPPKRPT